VARTFSVQFYNEGLLLKYFHPEDMRRWNAVLAEVGAASDTYVTECVARWRENREITKEDAYNALKPEKDKINYTKDMSEYILGKL